MQKIILASVLKPIDDTRVYEKFGLSLAKLENTEIIIFGTKTNDVALEPLVKNIRFVPYDEQKKSSRLKVSRLFYALLLEEKPQHIIVHTIELLPVLLLYKVSHPKVALYYDMLENYPLNFKVQEYHSKWLKYFISTGAYCIEKISFPFLRRIFIAEKTYAKEKQLPQKVTLLENKYVPLFNTEKHKESDHITITFCGSITKIFGADNFMNFITNVGSCNNRLNLKFRIIGKAYEESIITRLASFQNDNVEIIGIDQFVPHKDIISAMINSDFVALPYPNNNSTKDCIPTKMYECLALGIPMLIQNNTLWESITSPFNAGLYIDFNQKIDNELLSKMQNFKAYTQGVDKNAFWAKNEKTLLDIIKKQ